MSSAEEKKLTTKIGVMVAIITLVFGFLGSVLQQTFFAGTYAQNIKNNTESIKDIVLTVQQLKCDTERDYVRKDVFDEFRKGLDDKYDRIILLLEKLK